MTATDTSSGADDGHSGSGTPGDRDLAPAEPAAAEPAYRPAPIAAAVAVLSALVVGATTAGGAIALGAAVVGVLSLVAGLVLGRVRVVSVGGGFLVVAVLFGGVAGVGTSSLLVGAVGAVLAYDAGTHAVELGHQLRADAPTTRLEASRIGTTTTVTAGAAALAYLAYTAGASGQPASTVTLALLAVFAFVLALR